jgi:hypothetical protein
MRESFGEDRKGFNSSVRGTLIKHERVVQEQKVLLSS